MRLPFILLLCSLAASAASPFLEVPYLQMGNHPNDPAKLTLMWHAPESATKFTVRVKPVGTDAWIPATGVTSRRIAVRGLTPHLVFSAEIEKLQPGVEFDYEVAYEGQTAFTSRGLARKSPAQSYKFALFGDCGQGTTSQQQVANQVNKLKPDFIFVPGDIVYSRGRISEYREKFYPVYNAEQLPLLRTRLMLAVPGNHDTATVDLTKYPDAQAYYYYWNQPLNGPDVNAVGQERKFEGDPADVQAALKNGGDNMKRMGSYSFDYGNAHWTVLDTSTYLEWSEPQMRDWLEKDLRAAQSATWRFVSMHHPPFNSSKAHFREQHVRQLVDLFEKYDVDLVIAGHVHNYQRTYPLNFKIAPNAAKRGLVDGKFTFDKKFDGANVTKTKAPIYLVSGAGGAGLYDGDQEDAQATWQRYTLKFVSKINSFSWFEIDGKKLSFRQIDANGKEVDRFLLTK